MPASQPPKQAVTAPFSPAAQARVRCAMSIAAQRTEEAEAAEESSSQESQKEE